MNDPTYIHSNLEGTLETTVNLINFENGLCEEIDEKSPFSETCSDNITNSEETLDMNSSRNNNTINASNSDTNLSIQGINKSQDLLTTICMDDNDSDSEGFEFVRSHNVNENKSISDQYCSNGTFFSLSNELNNNNNKKENKEEGEESSDGKFQYLRYFVFIYL